MAKSKVSQKDTPRQEITDLPFVKKRTKGMERNHFWAVKPTEDYTKDCQIDATYGALALEYMIENNNPYILTSFILDMARSYRDDDHHGIEVGFLHFIGEAAVSCPLPLSYMLAKNEQKYRRVMRYFDNMEEDEEESTGGEV